MGGKLDRGSRLRVKEVDGSPNNLFHTLILPNGTVTDNGDGTATYTPAGGGGAPALHGCRVRQSSNTSVPDSSATAAPFASEDFDTDSYHDTSTNNNRITIPVGLGGYYLVQFHFLCTSGAASGTWRAGLLKNNTGTYLVHAEMPNSTNKFYLSGSVIVSLAAGDYVNIELFQFNGGTGTVNNSTWPASFSAILIGT